MSVYFRHAMSVSVQPLAARTQQCSGRLRHSINAQLAQDIIYSSRGLETFGSVKRY